MKKLARDPDDARTWTQREKRHARTIFIQLLRGYTAQGNHAGMLQVLTGLMAVSPNPDAEVAEQLGRFATYLLQDGRALVRRWPEPVERGNVVDLLAWLKRDQRRHARKAAHGT